MSERLKIYSVYSRGRALNWVPALKDTALTRDPDRKFSDFKRTRAPNNVVVTALNWKPELKSPH